MKVVCDGVDLSIATAQVIKAISNKTTNPVLEGIKMTAENDTLILLTSLGLIKASTSFLSFAVTVCKYPVEDWSVNKIRYNSIFSSTTLKRFL